MSHKRKQTSISGFFQSASKTPKISSNENESQPESNESETEILAVAGPSNLQSSNYHANV